MFVLGSLEVFAVRYGTASTSLSHVRRDVEPGSSTDEPTTLDFYYWVVRTPASVTLVDCGFDPNVAVRRSRVVLCDPIAALEHIAIRPEDVETLVVTHCHYDHVGNLLRLPRAKVVIQAAELSHWRSGWLDGYVEPTDIAAIRSIERDGRLECVDGIALVAPNVRCEKVGGHTPGQSIVIVEAAQPIVLASDAAHYMWEIDHLRPYAVAYSTTTMVEAYHKIRTLRSGGALLVPGHDPVVAASFPKVHDVGQGSVHQIR